MRESHDNGTATDPASLDVMFDVLRDPHRRRILVAVSDACSPDGGEFTLEEWATDDEELEDLRPVLLHCHLPKLVENGYIERDPDTGAIRPGRNFEEIASLVSLLVEHEEELPAEWP